MKALEALQRHLRGEPIHVLRMEFPPPVARLVGFELVKVEEGAATFRLEGHRDKHANPMGTMHGGILCDIADAAMGIACVTLLEEAESFTTLELKINYLRPVFEAVLEARGRVVYRGKSLAYVECDVVSVPDEKLVAKANSTCLILRGAQATGR